MSRSTSALLLVPSLVAFLALALLPGTSGAASPAGEQDPPPPPVPTSTELTAGSSYAGRPVAVRAVVEDETGAPVVGVAVVLERRLDSRWRPVDTAETDEAGRVAWRPTTYRTPAANAFRARFAGDEAYEPSRSETLRSGLKRRRSVVVVTGPDSLVDETTIRLQVSWRTGAGEGVPGVVRVERRDAGGSWKRARRVRTGPAGNASFETGPRVDTRWRGRAARNDWVKADRSPVHRLDNRPPGTPVVLPSGAPKPRVHVPRQGRAVGEGANASVSGIPDGVWDSMTGRSWHSGCPVGRGALRLVRVNYWAYDGYRRRGELVVNADVAAQVAAAFVELYAHELPLRSIYRPDRFGYSSRVRGADDHRSMAAGNTSAFNCRDVVNRPGVRSPHAWGRSVDVNTWENPYRSATGLVPNSWWQSRSHPRVAWRSGGHDVVEVMARHGLRWTYGLEDTQHFDATPSGAGRRVVGPTPVQDCGPVVCE